MTIDPATIEGQSLLERVKAILWRPQTTWDAIAAEPAETQQLYKGYALPLAALSGLCAAVGSLLFPWAAGGFSTRYTPADAVLGGVLHIALWLASIYIMARVTLALAPRFGSAANRVQAHKLAVYSSTAALLAGVFSLHPMLSWLAVLGLYSLGLLFIGLPRLMNTPDEKRAQFFAAIVGLTLAATLVLFIAMGSLRNAASALFAEIPMLQLTQQQPRAAAASIARETSDVEEHVRRYLRGGPTIDHTRLVEQMPETLPGGFRLETSSSATAMGTAQARGEYRNGDARIDVTIVDLAGDGAVVALTPVADVRENRFDADSYARAQRIDGRLYAEQVNRSGGSATYAVLGRGVALSAQGTDVTADQVRAAVETISIQRLERAFGD
ncbi:Yip1 family protein [Vitreimonas sp.]|uniref:Yip1 family protein n=1 Tax=Vitreimonas sp. TaxID=3069702 RepID=UPI002D79ED58|nr:Yip1 family protein [Vitreimonas sp.]